MAYLGRKAAGYVSVPRRAEGLEFTRSPGSASGRVSFDAERGARGGHADRSWAIALACHKARGPGPSMGVAIGARVLGERGDRWLHLTGHTREE
jgi:hypothetical protein